MGRAPCCDKAAVKKGPWSPEEDTKLRAFIEENGTGGNWIALPHKIGLNRCGKSCRLRWLNYLRPNIKHGDFSEEEDLLISSLYISIGSRWSIIAAQLPGRTDNDVKNYWNTKLKKKLLGKDKRDHRRHHHCHHCNQETDAGTAVGKLERASPQRSMAASALERMQLHMELQSLCQQYPFPSTAAAATPPCYHQNLRRQYLISTGSNDTSRLGLGFHYSSSSTVSSEANKGLPFDDGAGGVNWDGSLDSRGSGGDEISSSSGAWDPSAVFHPQMRFPCFETGATKEMLPIFEKVFPESGNCSAVNFWCF